MPTEPQSLAAPTPAPLPFRVRAMAVLWPSFLMAGVQEMLVFAVVDPQQLHWFGAEPVGWPSAAVYTVSFFLFWGVISIAGVLTQLLELPPSGAGVLPQRTAGLRPGAE